MKEYHGELKVASASHVMAGWCGCHSLVVFAPLPFVEASSKVVNMETNRYPGRERWKRFFYLLCRCCTPALVSQGIPPKP